MTAEHSSSPAIYTRLKAQRYRLEGERCHECGVAIFPPRDVCPSCNSNTKEMEKMSGRGEVYSYTLVSHDNVPPKFELQAPFVLALVKLLEGPVVLSQLTDLEPTDPDLNDGIPFKVEVGMDVEMVTRKLYEEGKQGLINYGYKFRPTFLPSK